MLEPIPLTDEVLDAVSGGATLPPNMSAGELLAIQLGLEKNSHASAAWSVIAKERSDTLKGVVQKF
jgi:hypothetical protein